MKTCIALCVFLVAAACSHPTSQPLQPPFTNAVPEEDNPHQLIIEPHSNAGAVAEAEPMAGDAGVGGGTTRGDAGVGGGGRGGDAGVGRAIPTDGGPVRPRTGPQNPPSAPNPTPSPTGPSTPGTH